MGMLDELLEEIGKENPEPEKKDEEKGTPEPEGGIKEGKEEPEKEKKEKGVEEDPEEPEKKHLFGKSHKYEWQK